MTDQNHDPIRELIPFYVAGTLTGPEHEQVERALADHPEFAADLHFWQHAAAVIRAEADSSRLGHLPSDRLVELAEFGPGRLEPEWATMTAHLENCAACQHDLATVRASLEPDEANVRPMSAADADTIRSRSFLQRIPLPALAAAAVILLLGIGLLTRSLWGPRSVTFTLRYAETTRSTESPELPVIDLAPQDTSILLHVDIPHTEQPPESFEITIEPPGGASGYLTTGYAFIQRNARIDRLSVVIDPRLALPRDGRYRLTVKEVRPPGGILMPEAYAIAFAVSRRAP